MQRIHVEAKFEIKTIPFGLSDNTETIPLDYSYQFPADDEKPLSDLIRQIKDRIRTHAQAYNGQLTRIGEIQITIPNP